MAKNPTHSPNTPHPNICLATDCEAGKGVTQAEEHEMMLSEKAEYEMMCIIPPCLDAFMCAQT